MIKMITRIKSKINLHRKQKAVKMLNKCTFTTKELITLQNTIAKAIIERKNK